jgi:hypothetical protein
MSNGCSCPPCGEETSSSSTISAATKPRPCARCSRPSAQDFGTCRPTLLISTPSKGLLQDQALDAPRPEAHPRRPLALRRQPTQDHPTARMLKLHSQRRIRSCQNVKRSREYLDLVVRPSMHDMLGDLDDMRLACKPCDIPCPPCGSVAVGRDATALASRLGRPARDSDGMAGSPAGVPLTACRCRHRGARRGHHCRPAIQAAGISGTRRCPMAVLLCPLVVGSNRLPVDTEDMSSLYRPGEEMLILPDAVPRARADVLVS